jgi:hypothetical protein
LNDVQLVTGFVPHRRGTQDRANGACGTTLLANDFAYVVRVGDGTKDDRLTLSDNDLDFYVIGIVG